MTTEEVFNTNQVINDKLAEMCKHGTTDDNRVGIVGEVRMLVTRLCLAIVEADKECEATKELSVL